MIDSKYFNRILAVCMIVAVAAATILRYAPQVLPTMTAGGITYDYETKLFDPNRMMTVNIVVEEEDWESLLENATDKQYVMCDIQINGETFSSVGIRAKGNTSLSMVASDDTTDRYSFKVEFDHYVDQTCYGLDKLALNNIIQDTTYMKEYLAYDLLTYMGIPASLYSFASVSVNGQLWGLYLALEVPEESYAMRNFGSSYGDLYKPESTNLGGGKGDMLGKETTKLEGNGERPQMVDGQTGATQMPDGETGGMGERPQMPDGETGGMGERPQMPDGETGGMEGRPQMSGGGTGASGGCDLVYTGDELDNYSAIWESSVFDTTDEDHQRIVEALKQISEGNLDGYLNVDMMLRYIAVNSVLVNYDSYFGNLKHNYYLYEKNGELTMLPWDYNLAFAGFQSNDATSAVNDPIDTPVSGTTLEERPLVGQVLEDDKNMEQYHAYLDEIVRDYFLSGRWERTIEQVDALISEYVANDPTAFYTYEEYKEGVANLKAFGLLRAASIQGQLAGDIPSTSEEQKNQMDRLIDASSISITAMGTQGGGKMGDRDEADVGPQMDQETFAPGATPGMGRGEREDGERIEQPATASVDRTTVVYNLVCITAAIIAVVCVKRYKRRKYVHPNGSV